MHRVSAASDLGEFPARTGTVPYGSADLGIAGFETGVRAAGACHLHMGYPQAGAPRPPDIKAGWLDA